jgi:predicted acetyltransferase
LDSRLAGKAMAKTDVSMSRVTVTSAVAAEQPLIAGLLQFYSYDFSEMEAQGSTRFEVDAQGRFESDPYLQDYWRDENRWPLLIRVDERVAGFALINTHSHRGGSVERNMAEFFVMRRHRRGGVGAEAVRQILAGHPGQWEVAVVARNAVAQSFWPRAIAAAANVSGLERVEGDGQHWRGPIWCFRAG